MIVSFKEVPSIIQKDLFVYEQKDNTRSESSVSEVHMITEIQSYTLGQCTTLKYILVSVLFKKKRVLSSVCVRSVQIKSCAV